MFAATKYSRFPETCQKFPCVRDNLSRIIRNDPRSHNVSRPFERQVEHGSEIDVEPQGAAVLADNLPVPAEKLWIIGRKNLGRRWGCPQYIPKPIHSSAFKINAREQWRLDRVLTIT